MKLTTVKLSKIICDPKVQARVAINNAVVINLTDAYEDNQDVPPPVLFTEDGEKYYCADGHHRLCALTNLEALEWDFDVRKGTEEDAFIFGCVTNGGPRGLPMTGADKRKAAFMGLDRWGSTMSDRQIASKLNLSHTLVSKVRAERGEESPAPKATKTKPKPKEKVSKGYKNKDDVTTEATPDVATAATYPKETSEANTDAPDFASVEASAKKDVAFDVLVTSPEITTVNTKAAAGLCLEALRLSIGKSVRIADEANQSRKYAIHHKVVLMMLNKALEEIQKWKGSL